MRVSKEGREFIKRVEGLELHMYRDSAGYGTIGYGHKVLPSDDFGVVITLDKAESLLTEDIEEVERTIWRYLEDDYLTEQHQYDAIASFVFNLGPKGLWYFKGNRPTGVMQAIVEGRLEDVPTQLLRWVYAGDQDGDGDVDYDDRVGGLVNRRKKEGALFRDGVYG